MAKYKQQIIIDLFPDRTSVILNGGEGVPFGHNIKQKLLQACEWENLKFSSRVKLSRRQTTQEVSPRVSLPGCRIPLLCTTFLRGEKNTGIKIGQKCKEASILCCYLSSLDTWLLNIATSFLSSLDNPIVFFANLLYPHSPLADRAISWNEMKERK